jgi:hypothetical protein
VSVSFQDIDFIIIGAAKSATTWLQAALQADPAIAMPDPELHYFSRNHARGDTWYLAQFPEKRGARLLGEKSNSYLEAPEAASRIRSAAPHVRLIALLRDPVERAYSDYCMLYRRGEVDADIHRHLDPLVAAEGRFIAGGRYAERLAPFLEAFPADRILVLVYEALKADPVRELARARAFLGVPPELPTALATERVKDRASAIVPPAMRRLLAPLKPVARPFRGSPLFEMARGLVARKPVYPPLDAELRARLVEHFREDTARLEELVAVDVSAWSTALRRDAA